MTLFKGGVTSSVRDLCFVVFDAVAELSQIKKMPTTTTCSASRYLDSSELVVNKSKKAHKKSILFVMFCIFVLRLEPN